MEYYTTKSPSYHKLINVIFIIILIATVISAILFFTLKINLTAEASTGEIVAENAAMQYLAPFESQIENILVKESDLISQGDTLIILKNEKLNEAYQRNLNSLEMSSNNIQIFEKQITNYQKKLGRQKGNLHIIKNNHRNKKQGKSLEEKIIKDHQAILKSKIDITRKRIKKDLQLLQEGAISIKEYEKRYKAFLDEKNNLNQKKNEVQLQANRKNDLETVFAEKMSIYDLDLLQTESEFLSKQNLLDQEKSKKEQLTLELHSIQTQLKQLYIIAEKDGHIAELFNIKSDVNLVAKNQPLLYITPLARENFYAKLLIEEDEIKDITLGQTVHIKLKAYNHYQFGVLKGTIKHISKQLPKSGAAKISSNSFYILVDISQEEAKKMNLKNGFQISGEVLLDEVRLSRYVYNSMFKKLNN